MGGGEPDVKWLEYRPQRAATPGLQPFLADINCHLKPAHGNRYRFANVNLWGHEATHGINSDLSDGTLDGFYVGNNRAVRFPRPRVRLLDARKYVPAEFKGQRYEQYMVRQPTTQPIWNERALYIFNEWTAYNNGLEVSLEYAAAGHAKNEKDTTDDAKAVLNMAVMGTCVAAEIWVTDPAYWREQDNFRAFFAHEVRRSLRLYRAAQAYPHLRWDSPAYEQIRTAKSLQWVRDAWADLGITVDEIQGAGR